MNLVFFTEPVPEPRVRRYAERELAAAEPGARIAFLNRLASYNARAGKLVCRASPDDRFVSALLDCRPLSPSLLPPPLRAHDYRQPGEAVVAEQTVGFLVGKSWGKNQNFTAIYLDLELLTGQLVRVLVSESGSYDWRKAPLHYLFALSFSVSPRGWLRVNCLEEPLLPLALLEEHLPGEEHALFYHQQTWQNRRLVVRKDPKKGGRSPAGSGEQKME